MHLQSSLIFHTKSTVTWITKPIYKNSSESVQVVACIAVRICTYVCARVCVAVHICTYVCARVCVAVCILVTVSVFIWQ